MINTIIKFVKKLTECSRPCSFSLAYCKVVKRNYHAFNFKKIRHTTLDDDERYSRFTLSKKFEYLSDLSTILRSNIRLSSSLLHNIITNNIEIRKDSMLLYKKSLIELVSSYSKYQKAIKDQLRRDSIAILLWFGQQTSSLNETNWSIMNTINANIQKCNESHLNFADRYKRTSFPEEPANVVFSNRILYCLDENKCTSLPDSLLNKFIWNMYEIFPPTECELELPNLVLSGSFVPIFELSSMEIFDTYFWTFPREYYGLFALEDPVFIELEDFYHNWYVHRIGSAFIGRVINNRNYFKKHLSDDYKFVNQQIEKYKKKLIRLVKEILVLSNVPFLSNFLYKTSALSLLIRCYHEYNKLLIKFFREYPLDFLLFVVRDQLQFSKDIDDENKDAMYEDSRYILAKAFDNIMRSHDFFDRFSLYKIIKFLQDPDYSENRLSVPETQRLIWALNLEFIHKYPVGKDEEDDFDDIVLIPTLPNPKDEIAKLIYTFIYDNEGGGNQILSQADYDFIQDALDHLKGYYAKLYDFRESYEYSELEETKENSTENISTNNLNEILHKDQKE